MQTSFGRSCLRSSHRAGDATAGGQGSKGKQGVRSFFVACKPLAGGGLGIAHQPVVSRVLAVSKGREVPIHTMRRVTISISNVALDHRPMVRHCGSGRLPAATALKLRCSTGRVRCVWRGSTLLRRGGGGGGLACLMLDQNQWGQVPSGASSAAALSCSTHDS